MIWSSILIIILGAYGVGSCGAILCHANGAAHPLARHILALNEERFLQVEVPEYIEYISNVVINDLIRNQ